MSHNVLLSGIKFTDIDILEGAFNELLKDNPECATYRFDKNPTTIRGWYGRMTKVDMAIHCPDQPYDIGFVRDSDGSYSPILESGFHAPGIGADVSSQSVTGNACRYGHENSALGKLQQLYAIRAAEDNASREGFITRRIYDRDKGIIQLHVAS